MMSVNVPTRFTSRVQGLRRGLHRGLTAAALAACLAVPAGSAWAQADEPLTKLVIVMRDGTSVPTASATELANWASRPWPAWNQAPGALTPQGAQGVRQIAKFYRQTVAEAQMMTLAGCPSNGALYVYADLLERTQATGREFADGFAPGCGVLVRMAGSGRSEPFPAAERRGGTAIDPLFHPLEAGVCRIDPLVAQGRVLERVYGDFNRATRELKSAVSALQGALECCKPALCTAFGRGESCKLADLPTAMAPLPDGTGLEMIGALPIGAGASAAIFDQYLAGMPVDSVGWGRISPAELRDAVRLSTEYRDLMQRTPYLARKRGSALLHRVTAAVTSSRMLGFGVIDPAVRDAAVVVFVGDENNLWNLASLMDVSWSQAGFHRNQVPPGGALVFEVRENVKEKKLRVYTSFVAQNIEQLRKATPLNEESLPARTPLRLPGCGATGPGLACTIEEFAVAMRNNIDRECVE